MFRIILLFILGFISYAIKAQENQLVKPQVINSTNFAESKQTSVIENTVTKTYLIKNVEYYEQFIKALEGKKTFLKSDSILDKKADSLNWYNRIDEEIDKAKKELLKIKSNEK